MSDDVAHLENVKKYLYIVLCHGRKFRYSVNLSVLCNAVTFVSGLLQSKINTFTW